MPEAERHVIWEAWDASTLEHLTLRWDNGGWVAQGAVSGLDVNYALRLGPDFRTRQFLLFRDLVEPDLWLATDGRGGWGEVNGAERPELQGCYDLSLRCSPFPLSIAVRTLGLAVGESMDVEVAAVDVGTLGVEAIAHAYTRLSEQRWHLQLPASGLGVDFEVDADGLVVAAPGWFRRVPPR